MFFRILLFITLSISAFSDWKGDEAAIVQMAKEKNLPIVAVFLSGEGCPWSHKFVEDVLASPQFVRSVGVDAILWEITLRAEEEDMRQKYAVKEAPMILLLDPKGKEFARLGYSPKSRGDFAEEIMGLINGFQDVCVALDHEEKSFDEEEWKRLYFLSTRFSVPCYKRVILERGFKKEKGNFFHVEKYAAMLEKYKLKNPEVQKLRKQVLRRDALNAEGTHFKVAVLDFQKSASSLKAKERPEKALLPLLTYLRTFEGKDEENLWKAELFIAEFLFSRHLFEPAIKHAEESLRLAPESDRSQVLQAIDYIKGKL